MIAALIMMLQHAEGARDGQEPNESDNNGGFSQWIFTDMAVAFGWLLLLQALMLMAFLSLVGKINGGLEPAARQDKFNKVFHLEGREVFHVDLTRPKAGPEEPAT